jgi:hypothetical protein
VPASSRVGRLFVLTLASTLHRDVDARVDPLHLVDVSHRVAAPVDHVEVVRWLTCV